MKYQKRPDIVDALQWTGDNTAEVIAWIREGGADAYVASRFAKGRSETQLVVEVSGRQAWVTRNHWIVADGQRTLSTYHPDDFARRFDAVTETREVAKTHVTRQ